MTAAPQSEPVLASDGLSPISAEKPRKVATLSRRTEPSEWRSSGAGEAAGDEGAWIGEVEAFLADHAPAADAEAVLTTVVFTDIVDSTARAVRLGDHHWVALLAEHDAITRRELARAGGRMVKSTGDGVLACFDSPGRAVRWAARMRDAVRPLDLQLRIGVHSGECRRTADDLAGIAVHVGARVAALAGPDEVLVCSTVKDLTRGSELRFAGRGAHQLKGLPEPWSVFGLLAS